MSYPVFMVPAGDVLPVYFDSFDGGTGASITLTGLATSDIEIYRDGSTTQRASDAGYTLLDTDGIDFDGITGIHGFSIDTGDNTDAGFYTVGAWFTVVVSAVTIDAQTVSFVAAQFRLMAAESVAAKPKVDVDAWLGTAAATPTVAGVPEVDLTHVGGATTNVAALATNVDAILTDTGTTLQGELDGIQAVVGALNDAAADGAVTTTDTVVSYLKQIINTLEGAPGIPTWPAAAAPGNAVSIAEAIRQIYDNLVVVDDLIDTEVGAIKTVTDAIGATGTGLSAIPWNAAWDAEVQSEVDDALVAQNLDHLVKIAVDTNFATTVHLDSVIGQLADAGGTATFDRTTDALEVLGAGVVVGSMAANSVTASALATDAVNEIVDQVWEEAIGDHNGTAGSTAAALSDAADALSSLATSTSDLVSALVVLGAGEGAIGATGNDTTHAHLNVDGFLPDDALNGLLISIRDEQGVDYHYVRWITDYVGATSLATLHEALPFTPAAGDNYYVLATARDDVTGGSGLDAAGVRAAIGMSSANLDTQLDALPTAAEVWSAGTRTLTALDEDSTTLDLDATILAAVGLASANLDTQLADIETKVDDLETRLGTPSDLGSGATVAANLVDIEGQTDDIGVAGAGLTALATQASVNTIDDFLDTEIAAIKAKTDNLPAAPAATGDIPSAATIADAVWDEALSGHVAAGSTGEALDGAGGGGGASAADIADAVWDEARSGHVTAGTFGAGVTSVAGNVDGSIGSFSTTAQAQLVTQGETALSNFGPLKPTVAGRTLDVSAGGEAGVDWANVGSPTTTVNLSGTTVKTATDVETDTADIQNRLPAALVSGRMDSDVGALQANVITAASINSAAITSAKFASGAVDAAALATDAVAEIADGVWDEAIGGHTTTGTTGAALYDTGGFAAAPTAAAVADAVWDEARSGHVAAGSFGEGVLVQSLNSTARGQVNTEADTALSDYDPPTKAEMDTGLDAIPTATENADALLARDMSSVTGEAARSPLNALRALRNKTAIAGGTLTVYEEDDSTSAWTATVATTAGDPVSSVDPA